MQKILLLLMVLIMFDAANAQQAPIMVCNATGTTCTPYSNLDTAILNASAGNYIYLSGGNFNLTQHLKKELHFIGAGHYNDSSTTTGITMISGTIYLDSNSDYSSFEGFYADRFFTNDTVNNIVIRRCNFGDLYGYPVMNYLTVSECIARGAITLSNGQNGVYGTNNYITNSIINGISNFTNSTIKNCIFYGGTYCPGAYATCFGQNYSNTIKNNVIYGSYSCGSANVVMNNLFTDSSANPLGANISSGNLFNVPDSNIFQNALGNQMSFSYSKNYHLKVGSPGHNAGDDGTDVGIYGSGMPYKEGGVPSNPHIYFKSISGTTNSSGDLPVSIKVRAEN